MKIAIVGTGYVGLVTGISLASLNHNVICIDQDQNKVAMIKTGKSPFYEPKINKLLKRFLRKKLLSATGNLQDSVKNADIIIIAVGTPTIKNKIDLSAIKEAAKQIGRALNGSSKYRVVAVKSTVLPGVTEKIVKPILEKNSGKTAGEFGLVMNPEFLREGSALEDALHPDRIVIGQIDAKSGRQFAKIYIKISTPKIFTNLWTAEMTKYASNALFATLISFSNEIARISEHTRKIDAVDVWQGVHLDKRFSPVIGKRGIKPGILNYIFSGCGFGGSCFPKDIKALASFSHQLGIRAELIESVININNTQPKRIIYLLKNVLGKRLKDKKIAVLGLAFKPNTDDTRESIALPLMESLLAEKAKVFCHDPIAVIPKHLAALPIIRIKSLEEAIKGMDAVIITTAWNVYAKLKPKFFKDHMKQPIIIDGRRIFAKELFIKEGIKYKGIGFNPK